MLNNQKTFFSDSQCIRFSPKNAEKNVFPWKLSSFPSEICIFSSLISEFQRSATRRRPLPCNQFREKFSGAVKEWFRPRVSRFVWSFTHVLDHKWTAPSANCFRYKVGHWMTMCITDMNGTGELTLVIIFFQDKGKTYFKSSKNIQTHISSL